MKSVRKAILAILALLFTFAAFPATGIPVAQAQPGIYIPLWMQPNTVIVYDANLNYTVIQGGELSADDLVGRWDIEAVGLTSNVPDMLARPNIKVEYDLHGFHQNIYYPKPGSPGEYQLSNPIRSRYLSGIMADGTSTGDYGRYMNYDTGSYQYNRLTRSGDVITGTGRITFFTGPLGEAGTHTLVKYDCATKMKVADIKGGTTITAENTYADKSRTFKKWDVGSLNTAILDIWSDSNYNAITELSTTGIVDNVYSGYVSIPVVNY